VNCQNCKTTTEEGYSLCEACELRFAGTLLRLARDITPLHDSLDATLHPGGHSPARIQTATPPTPIRLDVLDLIDMLDASVRELWRCLDGIDALDWRKDPRMEDLEATLIACAGHPKLATFPDAGLYMHVINDLARKVDTVWTRQSNAAKSAPANYARPCSPQARQTSGSPVPCAGGNSELRRSNCADSRHCVGMIPGAGLRLR
jgi:hypothetical protein